MKRDAQKDPAKDADAARARLLVDQVLFLASLYKYSFTLYDENTVFKVVFYVIDSLPPSYTYLY